MLFSVLAVRFSLFVSPVFASVSIFLVEASPIFVEVSLLFEPFLLPVAPPLLLLPLPSPLPPSDPPPESAAARQAPANPHCPLRANNSPSPSMLNFKAFRRRFRKFLRFFSFLERPVI